MNQTPATLDEIRDLLVSLHDRLARLEAAPDHGQDWLSVPEGARVLGLNETTLRRRINAKAQAEDHPEEFKLDGVTVRQFGQRLKLYAPHCRARAG